MPPLRSKTTQIEPLLYKWVKFITCSTEVIVDLTQDEISCLINKIIVLSQYVTYKLFW